MTLLKDLKQNKFAWMITFAITAISIGAQALAAEVSRRPFSERDIEILTPEDLGADTWTEFKEGLYAGVNRHARYLVVVGEVDSSKLADSEETLITLENFLNDVLQLRVELRLVRAQGKSKTYLTLGGPARSVETSRLLSTVKESIVEHLTDPALDSPKVRKAAQLLLNATVANGRKLHRD